MSEYGDPSAWMFVNGYGVAYWAMRDSSAATVSRLLDISEDEYLGLAARWCDGPGLIRGLQVRDGEVVER